MGMALFLDIPESMKEEHEMLHEELRRATMFSGKVGEAARRVADVLHPHFMKENEIALPEISVARELAENKTSPNFEEAKRLSDRFKQEYQKMLEEHVEIVEALNDLEKEAKASHREEIVEFAKKLKLHASTEEALTYPAVLMIGKLTH